jgi:hypothetical protein
MLSSTEERRDQALQVVADEWDVGADELTLTRLAREAPGYIRPRVTLTWSAPRGSVGGPIGMGVDIGGHRPGGRQEHDEALRAHPLRKPRQGRGDA